MGIIFGTMFFLMFTPTKWIHHFGLFAAVGAAMAALATVLVSPVVLRSARNRMAFTAAVLFVLALCFATTNGWWYVSSFGVPFNNSMPKLGGVTVSTIFFALFAIAALWAFWLHFAPRDRPKPGCRRLAHRGADPDRRRASWWWCSSASMARRRGAPVPDLLQRLGQPARVRRWLRAGRRRARRTRRQRRLPDARCPATTARSVRWAAPDRSASPPTACRTTSSPRRSGMTNPQPGTDYDWDAPVKLTSPGHQRIDGAAALRPRPGAGPARGHVLAGRTTGEPADLGLVSSCPPPTPRIRWSSSPRRARITGNSVVQRAHRRARPSSWSTRSPDPTARRCPPAGSSPTTSGPSRRGATCASPASEIPADADRGPRRRRGPVADPGRLGRGDTAAGARAAVGAGVHRFRPSRC